MVLWIVLDSTLTYAMENCSAGEIKPQTQKAGAKGMGDLHSNPYTFP